VFRFNFSACYLHVHADPAQPEKNSLLPALPVIPTSAKAWSQAAKADIEAAFQETMENHPGVYDVNNPRFTSRLKLARKQGLSLAQQVTNAAGFAAAIDAFSVALHDGHAGAFSTLDEKILPATRWPGFVAIWRGESLYVYASESGEPQAGAKVIACDGVPIRDLILKNVLAFQGRADEPGHWWVRARKVFMILAILLYTCRNNVNFNLRVS